MDKIIGVFLKVFIICIFSSNLNADPIYTREKDIKTLTEKHHMYLDTKSTKGWIKLFKNKESLSRRHYDFSEDERLIIINYLNMKYSEIHNKYKRGVE